MTRKNKNRKIRNIASKVLGGASTLASFSPETAAFAAGLAAASAVVKPGKRKQNGKKRGNSNRNTSLSQQTSKLLLPEEAQTLSLGKNARAAAIRDIHRFAPNTGDEGNRVVFINPNSLEYYRDVPAMSGSNEYPVSDFDSAWTNVDTYSDLSLYDSWAPVSGYVRLLPLLGPDSLTGTITIMHFRAGSDPADGFDSNNWPDRASDRCVTSSRYTMAELAETGGLIVPYIIMDDTPTITKVNSHSNTTGFHCIAIMIEGAPHNTGVISFECVFNFMVIPSVNSGLISSLAKPIPPGNPGLSRDFLECNSWLLSMGGVFSTPDVAEAQRRCRAKHQAHR